MLDASGWRQPTGRTPLAITSRVQPEYPAPATTPPCHGDRSRSSACRGGAEAGVSSAVSAATFPSASRDGGLRPARYDRTWLGSTRRPRCARSRRRPSPWAASGRTRTSRSPSSRLATCYHRAPDQVGDSGASSTSKTMVPTKPPDGDALVWCAAEAVRSTQAVRSSTTLTRRATSAARRSVKRTGAPSFVWPHCCCTSV